MGTDLTIAIALGAGLLSFLSPCVLPLVPAYIGQLTAVAVVGRASGEMSRWLAIRHAIAYVAGFGSVFTLLGLTATYLAGPLVDVLPLLRQVGGIVLILLGLNLAGILKIPALERSWRPLDAGAAGSLASATGTMSLGTPGASGGGPGLGERLGGRIVERARRVARVVRSRRDLRDRLDALHRRHPRRDPHDGRHERQHRPGRAPPARLHGRPGDPLPADRRRYDRAPALDPPARAPRARRLAGRRPARGADRRGDADELARAPARATCRSSRRSDASRPTRRSSRHGPAAHGAPPRRRAIQPPPGRGRARRRRRRRRGPDGRDGPTRLHRRRGSPTRLRRPTSSVPRSRASASATSLRSSPAPSTTAPRSRCRP